ncbi:hypothetical protein WJX82_000253 [Trebouxia sp. C0006]
MAQNSASAVRNESSKPSLYDTELDQKGVSIRSLSSLLQQAVHLVQTSSAGGSTGRDSSASLAQGSAQYIERADQETQAVYEVGQSNADLLYVQQEAQPLSSEVPYVPNSIQNPLPTGSKSSSNLVDESGAGWLITASNNLLNLWGCTCIGSPGEPALQLVHSLDTEFQVSELQINPANSLLMAAARDTKALTECVALHHLRMSPGIFRLKGRLGLPAGVTGKLAKNTGNVKTLQVQSVHSHQGVLAGCCAASHDRTVTVYPSNVTAGEVAKHKAVWKAHGRLITVLHASTFCPMLLTGDVAGVIHIWNMRSKPSEPEAKLEHEKAVTGIHSIGQRSFVSCSLDGRLCVWDFNAGSRKPLYTVSAPDGGPINKMAVRQDSLVAFCTSSGLYVADVSKSSPVHTVAVNQAHEAPTLCLAWNTGSTGQTYLYANNGATVSVYRASQYDVPSV